MTTISDTDLKVFASLANPQKANVSNMNPDEVETETREETREKTREESDEESERRDDSADESDRSDDEEAPRSEVRSEVRSEARSEVRSEVRSEASAARSKVQTDVSRRSSYVAYNEPNADEDNDEDESDDEPAASRVSKHSHKSGLTNRSRRSETSPFDTFFSNNKPAPPPPLPPLHTEQDPNLELLDKQQVLMDMERLKMTQGIRLSKEWTVNDRLEDMQFEVRRHMLHIDETNNINMMRDGMKLLCSGFEMVNAKVGILELDGWAAEVCADIDKYDNALGRIYRKYWRKSTRSSPEMEIAMGLLGSVGMYHFKRKMHAKMFKPSGNRTFSKPPAARVVSESDSEESAPP